MVFLINLKNLLALNSATKCYSKQLLIRKQNVAIKSGEQTKRKILCVDQSKCSTSEFCKNKKKKKGLESLGLDSVQGIYPPTTIHQSDSLIAVNSLYNTNTRSQILKHELLEAPRVVNNKQQLKVQFKQMEIMEIKKSKNAIS